MVKASSIIEDTSNVRKRPRPLLIGLSGGDSGDRVRPEICDVEQSVRRIQCNVPWAIASTKVCDDSVGCRVDLGEHGRGIVRDVDFLVQCIIQGSEGIVSHGYGGYNIVCRVTDH